MTGAVLIWVVGVVDAEESTPLEQHLAPDLVVGSPLLGAGGRSELAGSHPG
jgi:hypothetical protein